MRSKRGRPKKVLQTIETPPRTVTLPLPTTESTPIVLKRGRPSKRFYDYSIRSKKKTNGSSSS